MVSPISALSSFSKNIVLSVQSMSNTAVKAAPVGRWTSRDKAPCSAPYLLLQGLPHFLQAF